MAIQRPMHGPAARVIAALAMVPLSFFAMLLADARQTPRANAADGVTLQLVASGLSSPLGITNSGDSRLFITEQTGQIRIFDGTSVLPTPFLDVSSLIDLDSERGLLGLAFHPGYPTPPYFYIDYTNTSGDIVIARYQVSGDPNVADAGSALILKTISHPVNKNHNGGQLAFGPDGKLYVGVGDGGSGGDPPNNAQNLSVLLGKILRLDVDIAAPYIPAGNPFGNEIWAYGLRNPWRFSFDRLTGDLLVGDVGQGSWEEVDFQPASSTGGENYGWRITEGNHCYNPPSGCDMTGLTPPILEYGHGAGDCAIIGGVRYRGPVASFAGTYLYGDYCTGRIWGATQGTGGVWSASQLIDTSYSISSFGQDQHGNVYLTDLSGAVYEIVPPAASLPVGGLAEPPNLAAPPASGTSFTPTMLYVGGGAIVALAFVAGLALRRRLRSARAAGR
jgi:glucose/arabinose dehydrogenase